MANKLVRRFFMRNDRVVAEQIKLWFDQKVVVSYTYMYGRSTVTDSGMMFVKVAGGNVLLSRHEDFRTSYIIPAGEMVFMETDATVMYGDEQGYFILMIMD